MAKAALKVDKDLLKQIEDLAHRGLTLAKIANILGIHEGTLYEYKKRHPEIHESWKKGKYKSEAVLSDKLLAIAKDGDHKDQLKALQFILSRKHSWTEKVDIQVAPKPVVIERFQEDKGEVLLGAEDYRELDE